MNYSLGNMLGGAGAINPDKLALNLQFATDKTLTARRGPTPVFTRASTATHVGPTGLIGHAENLAFYSQRFDTNKNISGNIVFEGADLATAPDGTLTADRIRFTGGTTGSILATSLGDFSGSKVVTLWVKHVPTSDVVGAAFRLQFGGAVSSNFTATTQWQRFEFVTTDTTNSLCGIIAPSTGSTQTFDIWGIQYQRGTFSTEYLPTTTAAVYGARFDHDPITLACKGLLIEESRTNLLQRSEELNDAYWAVTRATITGNATTSPSGATTADKLIADTTAASNHRVDRTVITLALNTVYTFSIYAKAAEYTGLAIGVGLSATEGVRFSLVGAGTATPVAAGNTGTIQQLSNGWYRCTCTFTSDAVTAGHRAAIYVGQNGTTISYTGDGTSGIFIWGAQIEAGAFPTSYIPTTTASVVRSADICSITGASFTSFYNQSEGTLFVNAFTPANGDRTVFAIDDNTANEMIRLRTEGTNPFFKVTDGGSELVAIDAGTVIANTTFKLAGAYKLNNFASSINGGASVIDTTGTIPTVDRLRIGAGQSGNTMCGCISSLRYYKKRIADAKLQTLTA